MRYKNNDDKAGKFSACWILQAALNSKKKSHSDVATSHAQLPTDPSCMKQNPSPLINSSTRKQRALSNRASSVTSPSLMDEWTTAVEMLAALQPRSILFTSAEVPNWSASGHCCDNNLYAPKAIHRCALMMSTYCCLLPRVYREDMAQLGKFWVATARSIFRYSTDASSKCTSWRDTKGNTTVFFHRCAGNIWHSLESFQPQVLGRCSTDASSKCTANWEQLYPIVVLSKFTLWLSLTILMFVPEQKNNLWPEKLNLKIMPPFDSNLCVHNAKDSLPPFWCELRLCDKIRYLHMQFACKIIVWWQHLYFILFSLL